MACPSCGRETPPTETCICCGAALAPQRRLPARLFKWASLLLAVAGLLALRLSASRAAAPQVPIGQLNAAASLAYVGVSGTVVSVPRYDASAGFLSFHLYDGTGEIAVNAYRAETALLLSESRVPQLGDRVSLEGSLRLRDEAAALTLAAADRLVIERPAPAERSIVSITAADEHSLVTVRGQVQDRREPHPGLVVLVVADPTGVIDVSIPAEVVSLTGPAPRLSTGDFVQLTGAVTLVRHAPQLTLTSTASIRQLDSLPEPIPAPTLRPTVAPRETAISHITLAHVGQAFVLEGTLVAVEDFSAGRRFRLDDGTGAITLLVWQDVLEVFERRHPLTVGARVRVTGRIEEFRGELEIIPAGAGDLSLVP